MKKLINKIIIISLLFYSSISYAGVNSICEEDGSPCLYPWKIKVTNGSLTDNLDSTASLSMSLTDPNANKIRGWDDVDGYESYWTIGSGLVYSHATHTISTDTATSGWTDGGTDVTLQTQTDNVGIGGASLAKLSIDGDTDEVQFLVQGHSTQTSNLIVAEASDGTDRLTLSNAGVLTVSGSGSGQFSVSNGTAGPGDIWIYEDSDNGTNYVSIKSPSSLAANTVYTMPPDDGDANEVLTSDGSGNLSWEPGGATTWNSIGDASGLGTVDFAGFDQDITSSEDGGDILTITDTDADQATDSTILRLATNDTNDANTRFIIGTTDEDGTPVTDYVLAATGTVGGLTETLGSAGVKITTDGDGAITMLGLGDGSDEDLTLNLDDTSNTAVYSSSTGVTNVTLTSMSLTVGGTGSQSTITEGLVVNNGAGTDADDAFIAKGTGGTNLFQVLPARSAVNMTPMASPPSSATSGDLYVDSSPTPDELCFYDGAAWQGISSGTDANCA